MADHKQRIISSVFSRRNATGDVEESYVAHVKIWEDAGSEGGGRKPRYILLSQSNNGMGFIHKSKLNTNGTFSVGKTWRLAELRAVQVLKPLAFNITLSRTYRWQTENPTDQSAFLDTLIRLFRTVNPAASLHLDGLSDPDDGSGGRNEMKGETSRTTRTPSPSSFLHEATGPPFPASRPRTPPRMTREPEPHSHPSSTPISHLRSGASSRPGSPVTLNHKQKPTSSSTRFGDSSGTRTRSSSITMQPQTTIDHPRDTQPVIHSPLVVPISQRPASPKPLLLYGRKRGPAAPQASNNMPPRRDQNARISFYDPANQVTLDRLITGDMGTQSDNDGDDENSLATMSNVEDMIEGYEWASDDVIGRKPSGATADLIEARLLNELLALEKANIHSFLEFDDRIGVVLKYMDEAISELDGMNSLVSSYKIHLNTVSDDIVYIQSQNRGLQVQTQNQRALLAELENLLQTVNVDQEALLILNKESLENPSSMPKLEEAAAELYKALQAGRDTDMGATMERLQEYRTHNSQFCKRLFDFLSIMFTAQSAMLLGDNGGILTATGRARFVIAQHQGMESYLGRYAGLILYLKEMDESIYAKLCAAYFSVASELHSTQIKKMFAAYANFVKKVPEDTLEYSFNATSATNVSKSTSGIRRAGTLIRSPIEGRQKEKDKTSDGNLRVSEGFGFILEQLAPAIYSEDNFIADFLQINNASFTFADYVGLDNYFRRQATRAAGLSQSTAKLIRGAMDLIFGFLPAELKAWVDIALAKDKMEIIGVIACLERFLVDAEERGNQFLLNLLGKQHTRLKGNFDRHVNEQIKDIEQTKLSSKKRQGVAHFVKFFPTYVAHVENQLVGADGLEIRTNVDAAYEKIVNTIFDSLKQMAKMGGEEEDKGQLNYHVILIENMHYFVAETSQMDVSSMSVFSRQAETIYEENLGAYVKLVVRRPFGRIIDYFEGVERLLKTTAPSEVASNNIYSKSALRKTLKEYGAKDIRKHVDALFVRVTKHFAEASGKATTEDSGGIPPGTVMVGVWKSCEDELLRITELFLKRISQCYKDSGISIEYTVADVEGAFRRHRFGS